MNSKLLRLSLVGVLAASSLGLTACSDEQIALGAGVAIGAVIADSNDHDHHHHHPRYPRHRYPGHRWDAEMSLSTHDRVTVLTARHYSIPVNSADKILSALKAAEKSDFSKLADLGLTREDVRMMADGENPSVSTLQRLSAGLGLDLAQTHNVIQQMKADIQKAL